MPKSSSAKRQPSSFSAWMKRFAWREARDRRGLRDLEADHAPASRPLLLELIDHERQELVVAPGSGRTG